MEYARKVNALVKASPTLVDQVTLTPIDFDSINIDLYVSFDCEDNDQLDDLLQAIIDVSCTEIEAAAHDSPFVVTLQVHLPGAVSEDSMYEPSDNVRIAYNSIYNQIDVVIFRAAKKRTVKYTYP